MSNVYNHIKYCAKNPKASVQSRAINKRETKDRSKKWNKANKDRIQGRYVYKIFEKKDHKKRRIYFGDFLSFLSPTHPFYFAFLDDAEESEELQQIFYSVRHCRLACNLLTYLTYNALLAIAKDGLSGCEFQAVFSMHQSLIRIKFDTPSTYEEKFSTKEKFSDEDKHLVSFC